MAANEFLATGTWRGHPARFRNDQIIVGVESTVSENEIENTILRAIEPQSGAQIVLRPARRRWALVSVPVGTNIVTLAETVANNPGVRYAEPDFLIEGHSLPPNDGDLLKQNWYSIIDAIGAWRITTGHKSLLLAVLDSGIPLTFGGLSHEDLSSPRFITHHGSVSHDYIPTVAPGPNIPADRHGHGTYVTGVLAATANNTRGVAGVNWGTDVYIARVLDQNNQGYVGKVKEAMEDLGHYWHGRVVVNMSFGTTLVEEIVSLKQMCEDTNNGHFVLCCAPGFYKDSTGYHVDWPARFTTMFPHVISVGSSGDFSDKDVVRQPFEVQEPSDEKEVTVVAPGIAVYSTKLSGLTYGDETGTSMACPVVSGVASLMWSARPSLGPARIRTLLHHTGDKLVRGSRTYRRVNAARAVRRARWWWWWP